MPNKYYVFLFFSYGIMRYYLFIDESGDLGLKCVDKDFPVFVLCGVIFSEDQYNLFNERANRLKTSLWNSTKVIFHSRDIRLKFRETVEIESTIYR